MVWEAIFFLLVLKIPLAYLGLVLWWAMRAKPRPDGLQGALVRLPLEPDPRPGRVLRPRPRPQRRGPHGSPLRRRSGRASCPARARVRL